MDTLLIIKDILDQEEIPYLENEPMSRHTTFKIGGPARIMALPSSVDVFLDLIDRLNHESIEYTVIGNGSNLLVSDRGVDKLIIVTCEAMNKITLIEDNLIEAECGALLSKTASFALKHGLSKMECLSGIPGTVGGAVYMNAGAYEGEMSQIVEESLCCDRDGHLLTLNNEQHMFSYRFSHVKEKRLTVLKTGLRLEKGDKESIREKMECVSKLRREKQPLELPSAGSTFKRPEGFYAAALIENCSLKGKTVGGAKVSEKHAGFIVNTGNATCEDVLQLVEIVKESVYNKFKILLEMEVELLG